MRYRSIDEPYIPHIIEEYRYWTLLINENQRFLGRSVIWLVREGVLQDKCDLSDDEREELWQIELRVRNALRRLWQPDLFNYNWQGNLIGQHGGHGHEHLIPRYKFARTFGGVEFVDGLWGKNTSPSEPFIPEPGLLHEIRAAMLVALTLED